MIVMPHREVLYFIKLNYRWLKSMFYRMTKLIVAEYKDLPFKTLKELLDRFLNIDINYPWSFIIATSED